MDRRLESQPLLEVTTQAEESGRGAVGGMRRDADLKRTPLDLPPHRRQMREGGLGNLLGAGIVQADHLAIDHCPEAALAQSGKASPRRGPVADTGGPGPDELGGPRLRSGRIRLPGEATPPLEQGQDPVDEGMARGGSDTKGPQF